ncbi:MAG TPA: archease [Verrucomicrobiae bacterium]|nr:archease [Verrucomicrobiae bacterium]
MTEPFEFFDHTADIGAHIYGRTLEELFRHAAAALFEALGQFQKSGTVSQRSIELEAPSLEDLLHDWLAELLYEVEANHILYDDLEIRRVDSHGLKALVRGGTIDFTRSHTNEEIKAITYHQLRVESLTDRTWRATVIFDV